MLIVELDGLAVAARSAAFRQEGTRSGARMASRIMSLHKMLEDRCRRFNDRQVAAGNAGLPSLLPNGRLKTLDTELFGPIAKHGYPTRAAAILHGLDRQHPINLPTTRIRSGAAKAPGEVDPESYVFRLNDAPSAERSYGDMTAIGTYFDPLNLMTISWIGSDAEYMTELRKFYDATGGFCDWTRVNSTFASHLAGLGA